MMNLGMASALLGVEKGDRWQACRNPLLFRLAVLKCLIPISHNLRNSAKSADKTFPRRSGAEA